MQESKQVQINSDFQQNDENLNDNMTAYSKTYYEEKDTERADEGYEGDMDGEGGLMPPPSAIPR